MRKLAAAEIDRRVRDAAAKLEIAHLLDRRPSQLSGGQRQRVALGRAMVRQPAVFLMDEPLSNLDAALRISMRAEIKHLHTAMQTTFVYVTHDQAEALTLADRIVVMKDGVIQQIGTPDDVYERPRNMFVASFLGNPADQLSRGLDRPRRRCAGVPARRPLDHACRRSLPRALAARGGAGAGVGIAAGRRLPRAARPVRHWRCRGVVDSVLPVGSDRFIGLKVEGHAMSMCASTRRRGTGKGDASSSVSSPSGCICSTRRRAMTLLEGSVAMKPGAILLRGAGDVRRKRWQSLARAGTTTPS